MARSFHSSTASSMAPSLSSSESQNSNREHELEIEDEQIFGDDDRNVLVQSDHLQVQNPVRPSTVNFESNGATSVLEVGTSGSGSSPVITPTRSTTDMPNTVGNTARRDNGSLLYPEPEEHPVESQAYQQHPYSQQRLCWWESNYKEASIFLEEGENNDKFSHHPRSFDALPAYLLVHNKWFNIGDLCAAIVLLCLGFVEEPCMSIFRVPVQVHASIELCSLVLIATMQVLRTRWTGWRAFFGHKRTAIKVLALIVMIMEALVVIVHRHNHFRITRSVRPIFLIDNHFLGGVRRFIRQILQSLPPILDMLVLVFFVMLIYSVFGFYLFGKQDIDNFSTLSKSFVSLFILLTTANNPDVMMKSYNWSRWSCIFFISYLFINLYFLMNLMLAVVYDTFTKIEKEKFRRLFLHKRKAAQHAFKLLVTQERPDEVNLQHFEGLLMAYKPSATPTEAYLIFKTLNKSNSGYLNQDEFLEVYDACRYKWTLGRALTEWYADMKPAFRRCMSFIKEVVTSNWFEYTICFFVLTNGIILVVQTSLMSSPKDNAESIYMPWVTYFFVALYTVEACIKLLGLGATQYFACYWNTFDFCVTVLGILSLVFEFVGIPLSYIIILRPLRLLTLFRMKKRFRDVFGVTVILMPRLISAVVVLYLIYYFFAIIGMECFGHLSLENCCKNTTVEQFYANDSGEYYYLNNFQNMASAGVTLFELTVVNNWFIIMEGHTIVSGTEMTRAFFMIFYIFSMVVMTIIVAFILEAFLFFMQYKEFLAKSDEINRLTIELTLGSEEVQMLVQKRNAIANLSSPNNNNQQQLENGAVRPNSTYKFVGKKSRTKEQLQSKMYSDEMDTWLAEERQEAAKTQALARLAEARRHEQAQLDGDLDGDNQSENSVNTAVTSVSNLAIQVVDDEDEVTTIRRPRLPDIKPDLKPDLTT